MLDLIKINAPSFVEIEGVFFDIQTDFRCWLKFAKLINDEETTLKDLDYLYINEKPKDRKKGLKALLEFYNPPEILPRKMGGGGEIVLDYELDGALIYAAFMEVYKIDLFAADKKGRAIPLHWHKFQALLNGLHGTKLNEIMGYRAYNPGNKDDHNKQMQKLKTAWAIPHKESKADKKAREEFNALFEKNK